MIKIFLFSLLTFTCIGSHAQGILDGFINAPKSKTLAISMSVDKAESYFLWNRDLDLPITSSSISIFYKQQFTKRFGVAGNIPLVNFKLQDGTAYLIYGDEISLTENLKITGNLGLGFSHPLTNYDTESAKSIGQQSKSIHYRAVAQVTVKNQFFFNARIGYTSTQSPTPSGVVSSVKLGYYKNKWYTDVWLEDLSAEGGKDYRGAGDLKADSFTELGVSTTRIGGVIYHQTKKKMGLFLGWAHTLDGRNAYKTSRISTGLVWKL